MNGGIGHPTTGQARHGDHPSAAASARRLPAIRPDGPRALNLRTSPARSEALRPQSSQLPSGSLRRRSQPEPRAAAPALRPSPASPPDEGRQRQNQSGEEWASRLIGFATTNQNIALEEEGNKNADRIAGQPVIIGHRAIERRRRTRASRRARAPAGLWPLIGPLAVIVTRAHRRRNPGAPAPSSPALDRDLFWRRLSALK